MTRPRHMQSRYVRYRKNDSVRWGGNRLTCYCLGYCCSATTLYPVFIRNKQLSFHYSHTHMIYLVCILGTFEPETPTHPSSPTNIVGSQFQFLPYLKCMLLVLSTLCGVCRPFCAHNMHNKHSRPHIKVHSGSPFR